MYQTDPSQAKLPISQPLAVPATSTQERVRDFWLEMLEIKDAGIHDDFFELGGDSIVATQLIGRIRAEFGIELEISCIFDDPTIAGIAAQIDSVPTSLQSVFAPIPRIVRNEAIPLSPAQERFWFLNSLAEESAAYVSTTALRLQGPLDVIALEKAFQGLLDRHEILRTVYRNLDGQLTQAISTEKSPVVKQVNLESTENDLETAVNQLVRKEVRRHFDLSQDLPLRATLLRAGESDHVLVLCIHHIASDGWSKSILFRDLATLYEATIKGCNPVFPELPIQFADYAKWCSENRLKNDRGLVDYWVQRLAGMPSLLQVPADRPRPKHQTLRGSVTRSVIAKELSESLHSLAREHGCTLFMGLLAAFQAVLSRYTRETDICVGSPVAHRLRKETEDLVGPFINTLVMRTGLSADPTFSEVLARVRETVLGAYDHQNLPFEQLLEILRPDRHLNHSPLIQVLFQLRNYPETITRLYQLNVSQIDIDPGTAQLDLALEMTETEIGLHCVLIYSEDLFQRATAERMLAHLENFIKAATVNPNEPISRLNFLSEEERRQVLYEWNETEVEYPHEKCIHELFEQQVANAPAATAVVFGDETVTYAELNRRANQLGHYLRQVGISPDQRVGICMERSVQMVVALLAVLKSGGAYVPLDPSYPAERLNFMLRESGAKVLLTQDHLRELFSQSREPLLVIDVATALPWASQLESNIGLTAGHLAYVIFTSGSTGTPRGVAIEHRSVSNLEHWHKHAFGLKEGQRASSVAGIGFDAAAWEIWSALCTGCALVLPTSA